MKILIIEDEPAAARRLHNMVKELLPEAEVVAELESIADSIAWLTRTPHPDLILLDIHLADGASFEIFEHCQVNVPVVFTTAYDEYALQAFKVNALDYLLKPIKREALKAALDKYQRLQTAAQTFDYQPFLKNIQSGQREKRFLIKLGQQIKLVEMRDVAYAYTQSKITFITTREGRRYPVDHTLDKLEELLPAEVFFRINRQFIVGMHAITEMHAYSKSRLKLVVHPATDVETVVSTERSPLFKVWLETA